MILELYCGLCVMEQKCRGTNSQGVLTRPGLEQYLEKGVLRRFRSYWNIHLLILAIGRFAFASLQ